MPDTSTKHAFGEKANLENAITQGKVNEFDEVFLTDTDELAYVNKQKEVKYVTPRTQNVVEFNGVTEIGGLKASDFPSGIPAGKSVEDILKMLIQKRIPATYNKPTITLGNSGTTAGTKEAGTTISPVLNATFTQKDAGALTEIKIQKNNVDIEGATSATSPYSYEPEDFVLGDETVTFRAVASYADGLASNYATAAQGALADTALQKADITTGTTNGTIAVEGTDVAVAGLKSAAYAETTAFDAAGAAAAVEAKIGDLGESSTVVEYVSSKLVWGVF